MSEADEMFEELGYKKYESEIEMWGIGMAIVKKYIPKLEHIYIMSRILNISVDQFVKGILKKEE